MGVLGLVRAVVAGLIICAGIIGLLATDAFAVAGKMTGTPPGATAVAGGSVTIILDEPVDGKTDFTSAVGQNGEVDFPPGVDPNGARTCRYTDETGKTVTFRCGGYFAMGGGMATAAASGWSSVQARSASNWTFDVIGSFGGTASLGSKDATTTGGGLATGQGTSGLSGLGGTTAGLMLRAHLPLKWTGPLGDVWAFVRGNYHFDREGKGGEANLHNPVPGNESSTSLKRGGEFEVGLGKSVETYCHQSGVGCQYIGVYIGVSIQRNTITVNSNEIVRAPSFEHNAWKPSAVAGAWYSVPLGGIGTGWDDYNLILGVDFRRVPCMTVNGASPLPATYQGKTDSFWEVTTWGGVGYSF